MMKGSEKAHVVVVPFPALGHSIPMLDFAKLLASHGLSVSYVTTAANVSRLQLHILEALSSGLHIRLLLLPTPHVEGLPLGIENFDTVPTPSCGLIFELADKLEEPFNRWMEQQFERESHPPVCIIHDALMQWTFDVAKKHKVATVVFNTYSALGTSLLRSAWLSATKNELEKQADNSLVLSLDLPTPITLHEHEIDSALFDPVVLEVIGRLQCITQSSGMVVNTFEELETDYLQHLENLTGKPVWPIGPLLPPNFLGGQVKTTARGKMSDISEEEMTHWLDSQSPRSVVYISFGSQVFLSEEQCKALAMGLEASQQPFIWSIKVCPNMGLETAASDDHVDVAATYLPQGFRERTKKRGLVIWGWVPQLVILSHSCVGAFMSHCGWNSMLESISLGVPLMTWPMHADQHFNSKLAVESGLAVQVCEHRDGLPERERVKEVVKLVMGKERGKRMKKNAQKLKEKATTSVELGGSSTTNLKDFVSEVQKLRDEMATKPLAWKGPPTADMDILDEFSTGLLSFTNSKTS